MLYVKKTSEKVRGLFLYHFTSLFVIQENSSNINTMYTATPIIHPTISVIINSIFITSNKEELCRPVAEFTYNFMTLSKRSLSPAYTCSSIGGN